LTLQARAAGRQLSAGQTEEVRSSLAAIGEDALRTLEETRLLIYELRPPVLEQSGLSGALRARLEAVEARGDVALTVEIEPVAVADPDVETGLYRIAQEALNNASRHAGATELLVRLAEADGRLILLVRDNGTGFDPAAVPDGHAGLRGIAERVAAMNGRLTLNSAPGAGTELFVEVPV
jgi:signal transduction histidine kinase